MPELGVIPLLGHDSCTKCTLSETRLNVVAGYGNPKSRLVVVGEAPGREEDEQSRPWVGPAGKLLRAVITGAGHDPEEFFYTNVYHCRPPRNLIAAAKGSMCPRIWLAAELAAIQPHVVLALGRTANDHLRPEFARPSVTMKFLQSKDTYDEKRRCWIVGGWHPSYLLRQSGSDAWGPLLAGLVFSIQRCQYYLRDMQYFPPETEQQNA